MLTVSKLSTIVNTTPDAIRHYVRIGLLSPSRDAVNDYKVFSQEDIKKAKFIHRAKGLGFSLADIKTIFEHSYSGNSPCSDVRKIIRKRFDDNRDRLDDLVQLQKRMGDALKKWEGMPDGTPDDEIICYLIESIDNE